ncbi:hypothetical protein MKW94_018759 [Papaver nudicaule]|uniref:Uncharacterized protein n=1 Tax=Papaver nudicaule TaxID=74823 RepID=A0AA41SIS1_PAPNU|nr:hypothetical protein [Papaver nudicaule]
MDRFATDNTTSKATKTKRMQSLEEAMKLATLSNDSNLTVKSANMHVAKQLKTFPFARNFLSIDKSNTNSKSTPTQISLAIKNFGSFVTYSPGGFLYFFIDNLSLLLFKTEVQHIMQ